MKLGVASVILGLGVYLNGCSGDVNVHGVPEEIALDVPFCVPAKETKDAGRGDSDSSVADGSVDSGND